MCSVKLTIGAEVLFIYLHYVALRQAIQKTKSWVLTITSCKERSRSILVVERGRFSLESHVLVLPVGVGTWAR